MRQTDNPAFFGELNDIGVYRWHPRGGQWVFWKVRSDLVDYWLDHFPHRDGDGTLTFIEFVRQTFTKRTYRGKNLEEDQHDIAEQELYHRLFYFLSLEVKAANNSGEKLIQISKQAVAK